MTTKREGPSPEDLAKTRLDLGSLAEEFKVARKAAKDRGAPWISIGIAEEAMEVAHAVLSPPAEIAIPGDTLGSVYYEALDLLGYAALSPEAASALGRASAAWLAARHERGQTETVHLADAIDSYLRGGRGVPQLPED